MSHAGGALAQGLQLPSSSRPSFRQGPSTPQTPAATPELSEERQASIEKAIEQLVTEARDLLEFEKETAVRPVFSRPHPQLRSFGAAEAPYMLDRMTRRFTGDNVHDTYVRYHLMWVYDQRPLDDRFHDGAKLLQLLAMVQPPPALGVSEREEYAYEPRDLWAQYRSLMSGPGTPTAVIGYPPWQRRVHGEAALELLGPEARARHEASVAQHRINVQRAQEILPRLTRVDFPENVAFNRRLRIIRDRLFHVRHAVRIHRGELIYALIKTTDPDMLNRVGREIATQADAQSGIAFDLMAYVYIAAFDGVLDRYDESVRVRFGQDLEAVARRHLNYIDHGPPYPRNFADYTFTAILTMREGDRMVSETAE